MDKWHEIFLIVHDHHQEEEVLWHATPEIKSQRLQRFTVTMEQQGAFESERLWQLVSAAIKSDDQVRSYFMMLLLRL